MARVSKENDSLFYWLLECYRTLTRQPDVDDGFTDDEMTDKLCSVLSNRGLDPNTQAGKQFREKWAAKPNRVKF